MAQQVNGQPYVGPLVIDASPLDGKLVDLPPGGRVGLRTEREGMSDVVVELKAAAPALGASVQEPYDTILKCTTDLAEIRPLIATVAKLLEVLEETESKRQHDRENALSMLADTVRSAARRKGEPGILASFEKTIRYVSQSAAKGAQTRKKNADAKKGAADA